MKKCKCKSCKRLMKIEKRREKQESMDSLLAKHYPTCDCNSHLLYGVKLWKSMDVLATLCPKPIPYIRFETELKGEFKT